MPKQNKKTQPRAYHPHVGRGYPFQGTGRDPVCALSEGTRLTKDGVDTWLDKEKPFGERSLR
jgi:hypothetical protein